MWFVMKELIHVYSGLDHRPMLSDHWKQGHCLLGRLDKVFTTVYSRLFLYMRDWIGLVFNQETQRGLSYQFISCGLGVTFHIVPAGST